MTGEARRRWVSEEQVLTELEQAADLSMATVAEFAVFAQDAAKAEAHYKSLRAKRVLHNRAMSESSRPSIAEAETRADAEDDVAAALLARLIADAHLEACREALRSIRTNQEALRTAAASARDGVVGPGMSGRR